jgi:hypothetical protein
MEDFQFLLGDLATSFREDALWLGIAVPGRFYVDQVEGGTGDIEPGVNTKETHFYCDRTACPQPWPTVGDLLTIRGDIYEIVEADDADDLGELKFRLIKQTLGLRTVTSEGVYSSDPEPEPYVGPGRPSRRAEIIAAYSHVVAAGHVSAGQPLEQIVNVVSARLGEGEGLSHRTLRKILGPVVRGTAR